MSNFLKLKMPPIDQTKLTRVNAQASHHVLEAAGFIAENSGIRDSGCGPPNSTAAEECGTLAMRILP